jgi:hypothetical protein
MVFYRYLYNFPPEDGFDTPVVEGNVMASLYIDLADK